MRAAFVDENSSAILHFIDNVSRQDFVAGDHVAIKTDKRNGKALEFAGEVVEIRHHIVDNTDAEFEHLLFVILRTY